MRKQANDRIPPYGALLSRTQRYLVDCMICSRYGNQASEVPYQVRHIANRNGLWYIDIKAGLNGLERDFNIIIANHHAAPRFADGLRAAKIPGSVSRDEMHVTLPLWLLPTKAGAWLFRN